MDVVKKIYILLCWGFFIFVLSTYSIPPQTNEGLGGFNVDKVIHFIFFLVLSLLIGGFFYKKHNFRKILFWSVGISFIYALAMELLQLYLPSRSFSWMDLIMGVAGGVAGIYLHIYYLYPLQKQEKKENLLLHICCAGCGAYVTQILKTEYNITLYYYNPNIFPESELNKRIKEAKKIAKKFNTPIIVAQQDHREWRKKVKGYENSPEGGERCMICYRDRLTQTAQEAKNREFDNFTTTMTVSPHKKANVINEIGKELEKEYKVTFLEKDFKKQDGFKKSVQLSKQLGLYRQNYCGCEFSKK